MHVGIWYALGGIVFLLIIYILFDNRKTIFKKRKKKEIIKEEKKEVKKEVAEKKKVKKQLAPKISLSKKMKDEKLEAEIESIDFGDLNEEPITYQNGPVQGPRKRTRPQFFEERQNMYEMPVKKNKKKKIKEQIKDLTPEIKEILLTNVLGKHEDK